MADLYSIRIGGQWHYNGRPADRGLLLTLDGAPNDEKLIRLGYLVKVERPRKLEQYPRCGTCGQGFVTDQALTAHGDKWHARGKPSVGNGIPQEYLDAVARAEDTAAILREVSLVPDVDGDDEDARIARDTPPYLEKTTASLHG